MSFQSFTYVVDAELYLSRMSMFCLCNFLQTSDQHNPNRTRYLRSRSASLVDFFCMRDLLNNARPASERDFDSRECEVLQPIVLYRNDLEFQVDLEKVCRKEFARCLRQFLWPSCVKTLYLRVDYIHIYAPALGHCRHAGYCASEVAKICFPYCPRGSGESRKRRRASRLIVTLRPVRAAYCSNS